MREKVSYKMNSYRFSRKLIQNQRLRYFLVIIVVLSFLQFIPLALARNIFVYTPIQGSRREKYFVCVIYKGKTPTLARNKHLSVHFFLYGPCLLRLSTKKLPVQFVRTGHQSGYSRAETINNNINKRSNRFCIRGN